MKATRSLRVLSVRSLVVWCLLLALPYYGFSATATELLGANHVHVDVASSDAMSGWIDFRRSDHLAERVSGKALSLRPGGPHQPHGGLVCEPSPDAAGGGARRLVAAVTGVRQTGEKFNRRSQTLRRSCEGVWSMGWHVQRIRQACRPTPPSSGRAPAASPACVRSCQTLRPRNRRTAELV